MHSRRMVSCRMLDVRQSSIQLAWLYVVTFPDNFVSE